MNRVISIIAVVIVCLSLECSASLADPPERRDYVLPSWGDLVSNYGPGVDPALDSPEAFEHMIVHWKGRGFRGVLLRTDLGQLDPAAFHRNSEKNQANPGHAVHYSYVDEVMQRFDVHAVGNAIAQRNDFEFWAWHAHMFSDGAPETAGSPGPNRIWPWTYVMNYTDQHPEAVTTDRTQTKRFWMVREYGYPEARATKIAEFVYMAKKFGVRRFVAESRSEASQMQDPPDNADRFGFNDIVVKDMKKRYGVNILTDPRFDVDRPNFNRLDPMVENWHKLRGEYFTQFFRELRQAMNEIDPHIQICASLAGERIGPPMGNWFTDWRTWVDEGLIDAIITPVDFDAYPTPAKLLESYLTCVKQDRGVVPFIVFHDYIKKSAHPDIKVITGGSFFLPNPPRGDDCWRITDWYDSYQMAWFQRWSQLMRDLDEFGYIKFFQQSFDGFPVNSTYHAGGYGIDGYVPVLRACPGVWYKLGMADGTLPSVQNKIHYGERGNAVKLTSDPARTTELIGYHSSAADRSYYFTCIEPAIMNGTAEFDSRIYRGSDNSGVTVFFQNRDDIKRDIGVRVAGGSGQAAYSDRGTFKNVDVHVPKEQWRQIRITVDFDKHAYSAALVNDDGRESAVICRDVPYMRASVGRLPTFLGSGISPLIDLKGRKMLNQVDFVPEGNPGSVTYVDEVEVRWVPKIPYDKPARNVLFAEDFERFDVGAHALAQPPQTGARWSIIDGDLRQAAIENRASYGEGVKSLRMQGKMLFAAGTNRRISETMRERLVLDFDVLVRSSEFYESIAPHTTTTTQHTVHFILADAQGGELIGFKTDNGCWAFRKDGGYVSSETPVDLDCWNHVQISLHAVNGSYAYKIVLQPVGELPFILASGTLPAEQAARLSQFLIETNNLNDVYQIDQGSGTSRVNFSCIDNVRLTAE